MSLIPEISFTKFMKMKAGEVKELKSFIVTSNGEFLFIVTVPRTPYIREHVTELCNLSNTVGGRELEVLEAA